jgi:UDP-N-acetylglucosamine 2-epimerase (non-hydrolysing)/GDP/UDP-N,N'-diacetylbacillosamine 2-epimerase (hydrolysing)
VCFVTGTRAEFGLMRHVLLAIQQHAKLKLQIVVTGMHLDAAHGDGLAEIKRGGWQIDGVVGWDSDSGRDRKTIARNTGSAIARLADAFADLKTDIVLVVGDRVEAFAAASAAHLSGIAVAHVHGGDRAEGQIDDSLRHAISKLAHIHFPATRQSAERLAKLGENRLRIHRTGSPGLDRITEEAAAFRIVREAVGIDRSPSCENGSSGG